jgi:hypothetical protein
VNTRPAIFIRNLKNPEFILMLHKSLVTVYAHNSLIRYFSIRIATIEIFPENAKVGQD